jgi:hypothetical protein
MITIKQSEKQLKLAANSAEYTAQPDATKICGPKKTWNRRIHKYTPLHISSSTDKNRSDHAITYNVCVMPVYATIVLFNRKTQEKSITRNKNQDNSDNNCFASDVGHQLANRWFHSEAKEGLTTTPVHVGAYKRLIIPTLLLSTCSTLAESGHAQLMLLNRPPLHKQYLQERCVMWLKKLLVAWDIGYQGRSLRADWKSTVLLPQAAI